MNSQLTNATSADKAAISSFTSSKAPLPNFQLSKKLEQKIPFESFCVPSEGNMILQYNNSTRNSESSELTFLSDLGLNESSSSVANDCFGMIDYVKKNEISGDINAIECSQGTTLDFDEGEFGFSLENGTFWDQNSFYNDPPDDPNWCYNINEYCNLHDAQCIADFISSNDLRTKDDFIQLPSHFHNIENQVEEYASKELSGLQYSNSMSVDKGMNAAPITLIGSIEKGQIVEQQKDPIWDDFHTEEKSEVSTQNDMTYPDPIGSFESVQEILPENEASGNIKGEDLMVKREKKPKPIAKRFQALGTVTVLPSFVQCLNVVLDYHGYSGIINRVVLNDAITNVAFHAHDVYQQSKLVRKHLAEKYTLAENEELVGTVPNANGAPRVLSSISGVLQRKIHIRDISSILHSVKSVVYVKSSRFNIHNPYEPQYYRYELDGKGKIVNESKCGMCTFCPFVKFLPFKNSSYLSHMTLEHGIFASNFVVPEGLYFGRYRMVRPGEQSKTRTVKALQCPACFQIIEVACWKNKTNPLLSYFRHFKKMHSNLNKTFTSSSVDPVALKHRGANLFRAEEQV